MPESDTSRSIPTSPGRQFCSLLIKLFYSDFKKITLILLKLKTQIRNVSSWFLLPLASPFLINLNALHQMQCMYVRLDCSTKSWFGCISPKCRFPQEVQVAGPPLLFAWQSHRFQGSARKSSKLTARIFLQNTRLDFQFGIHQIFFQKITTNSSFVN